MSLSLPTKHVASLHKAMLVSFPAEGPLRLWVEFNLGENLNLIKRSPGLDEIILDLFYWVESRRVWQGFLLAGIASSDRPILSDACTQALGALPPPPEADQPAGARDLLIWDKAPFVDRDTFWIDIDELKTSRRKRVAVVNGPPRSGKSYCGELLDHLRRQAWAAARLALLDLKSDQTPDIKPDELCRRLLLKLRVTGPADLPPPLPGQKPDRWARDLAAWVAGQIAQLGGQVWVVLDGCGQLSAEETHVFIAALAEEAGDQDDFRLVLLDYDKAFGSRAERATRRTRIDYLTASDLQAFLYRFDQQYKVSSKPTWAAAQELVTQYARHTPGSATQVDALAELLPAIIRSLI
jgi:hypothetical protein